MENDSLNFAWILGLIVVMGLVVVIGVWIKFRNRAAEEDQPGYLSTSYTPSQPIRPREPANLENVNDRLLKLKELREANLITEQEYERLRSEVLETTFRANPLLPQSPTAAQIPADIHVQIVALLRAHRKIEAIKIYRQETNLGLKEAKDAVEEIERHL